MNQVFRSTDERQGSCSRVRRQVLARFARRAHLPTGAFVAFAGILMIVPPASGAVLGARPSEREAGLDLSPDEAIRGADWAINSYGNSAAVAIDPAGLAKKGFLKLRLDSLVSLVPRTAPKALDPGPLAGPHKEYGFSRSRAGIRWRFSLVESAGERS